MNIEYKKGNYYSHPRVYTVKANLGIPPCHNKSKGKLTVLQKTMLL